MPEDKWRLISKLCREVVENENCALQITVFDTGMVINFYPLFGGEDDEYEEGD